MSARAWSQDDVAQRLRFGSGALAYLPAMLRELGLRKVVLITSAGRAAGDDGARLARLVGRALASTFAGVEPHLPVDSVRAAHTAVQGEGADGIVTFGVMVVTDCRNWKSAVWMSCTCRSLPVTVTRGGAKSSSPSRV